MFLRRVIRQCVCEAGAGTRYTSVQSPSFSTIHTQPSACTHGAAVQSLSSLTCCIPSHVRCVSVSANVGATHKPRLQDCGNAWPRRRAVLTTMEPTPPPATSAPCKPARGGASTGAAMPAAAAAGSAAVAPARGERAIPRTADGLPWTPGAIEVPFTKAQFKKEFTVLAARIPKQATGSVVKALTEVALNMPRVRTVVQRDEEPEVRFICLAQQYVRAGEVVLPATAAADAITEAGSMDSGAVATSADAQDTVPVQYVEAVSAAGGTFVPFTFSVGYEFMNSDTVLRALLPPEAHSSLVGFETAGHLAHFNLPPALLPYKYTIGAVVLDKNAHLRTVVNKTGSIETTFRTFPMELLAGVDDTNVTLRECGVTYKFDYAKVYWNSRLAHEHEYVALHAIPEGTLVADMCAGVGPFAIPLAARGCTVHANDLNPASYDALVANAKSNGVMKHLLAYNEDARAFVRGLIARGIDMSIALINLPAAALSFMDAFRGAYVHHPAVAAAIARGASDAEVQAALPPLPTVYVYCFSKTSCTRRAMADVTRRALCYMGVLGEHELTALVPPPIVQGLTSGQAVDGATLTRPAAEDAEFVAQEAMLAARVRDLGSVCRVRLIRNVAPTKLMMCVEIRVPAAAALARAEEDAAVEAVTEVPPPAAKRSRTEEA